MDVIHLSQRHFQGVQSAGSGGGFNRVALYRYRLDQHPFNGLFRAAVDLGNDALQLHKGLFLRSHAGAENQREANK